MRLAHGRERNACQTEIAVLICDCYSTPQSAIVTSTLGVPSAEAASASAANVHGLKAGSRVHNVNTYITVHTYPLEDF
jgi:hypothetical protein